MQFLVTFEITDFDTWLDGYKDHQKAREEAGIREIYCGHHEDNPCHLVSLYEAPSTEAFNAFMQRPENEAFAAKVGYKLESTSVTPLLNVTTS